MQPAHHDEVEVFMLQLEGAKRWRLHRCPKGPLPRSYCWDYKEEELGPPLMELVLEAGDLLYLPRGTVHKALLAVGAVSVPSKRAAYFREVLQLFRHEEAFVPSKIQGQAAASMAAALMAASVAAGPAQVLLVLAFLGFLAWIVGYRDDRVSDVYNQNDNPVNPYSQFSEVGSDSVYKARTDQEVTRRKKALTAAFERFDKTAFYIKTKQSQQLTSNLQEAAGFKQDMVYFSGAEGSDAYNKARE
ncbi:Bifunctional lysine-specific demethylase and histidyl-hydroxylase NO66 [Symbiodinium microadriaticum]|uniref:Bifunctional lysine-specific demethylase and histidyl-hydroxylase n=1 Tax=Symbiodinium microadriaticum TaxID=2951 RepID=A0A1Q9CKC5_SYMMI|nr:Bifunctional lysine-specific demethylase and histidyl-hydroxylase NO66 [Symbiodinium microadriaticum]